MKQTDMTRRHFLKKVGQLVLLGVTTLTGCEKETPVERQVDETIKAFHIYVGGLTKDEVSKQLNALNDYAKRKSDAELDKLWQENEETTQEPATLTKEQLANKKICEELRQAILNATAGKADIVKPHWFNIYRRTLEERADSFSNTEKRETKNKQERSDIQLTASEMAQILKAKMQSK